MAKSWQRCCTLPPAGDLSDCTVPFNACRQSADVALTTMQAGAHSKQALLLHWKVHRVLAAVHIHQIGGLPVSIEPNESDNMGVAARPQNVDFLLKPLCSSGGVCQRWPQAFDSHLSNAVEHCLVHLMPHTALVILSAPRLPSLHPSWH